MKIPREKRARITTSLIAAIVLITTVLVARAFTVSAASETVSRHGQTVKTTSGPYHYELDSAIKQPTFANYGGAPVALIPLLSNHTVAAFERNLIFVEDGQAFASFDQGHPAWPKRTEDNVLTQRQAAEFGWTAAQGQADGKTVTAGYLKNADAVHVVVARYLGNGSFDKQFGVGGVSIVELPGFPNNKVTSLSIRKDGKLTVAGIANEANKSGASEPKTRVFLMRFLPSGMPDPKFGVRGVVVAGEDENIVDTFGAALQGLPDGRMIVQANHAVRLGHEYVIRPWIRRLTANGELDRSYGQNGKPSLVGLSGEPLVAWRIVYAEKSRGLYILGTQRLQEDSGAQQCSLIKLNENGTRDENFGKNGRVGFAPQGPVKRCTFSALLEREDGDLLAGGFLEGEGAKFGSGEFFFLKHIPANSDVSQALTQDVQYLERRDAIMSGTFRRAHMLLQDGRLLIANECDGATQDGGAQVECSDRSLLVYLKRQDGISFPISAQSQADSEQAVLSAIRQRDLSLYKTSMAECGKRCRDDADVLGHQVMYAAMFQAPAILDDLLSNQARPDYALVTPLRGSGLTGEMSCKGVEVSDLNALWIAILDEKPDLLRRLLAVATPVEKNMALRYAAQLDRVDYLKMIVAAGGNIRNGENDEEMRSKEEVGNRLRSSLLDDAIAAGASHAVRWVIMNGIPVNGVAATEANAARRWTSLHAWIRASSIKEFARGDINDMLDTLNALMAAGVRQDIGVDVQYGGRNQSPLAYAIAGIESPLALEALLKRGVKTDRLDPDLRARLTQIRAKLADPKWRDGLKHMGAEKEAKRDGERTAPCIEEQVLAYRNNPLSPPIKLTPSDSAQRGHATYPKPGWSDGIPQSASSQK